MNAAAFWQSVAAYNRALWPVQAALILAGAALTVRVAARPGPRTDAWLKAFLAAAFAWNGTVVLPLFLRSPVALGVGAPLFLLVAVLFAIDIQRGKTTFRLPGTPWGRALTGGWLALVAAYPLVGWALLGHAYPQMLLPAMPCPLTVYAIAMVAAAPRVDGKVLLAMLPWALLGLPKCLGALDCSEDCILFASGVYGLLVFIRSRRRARRALATP